MRKNDPPGFRRFQGEVDKMFLELLGVERLPSCGRHCLRPNADIYFDAQRDALVVKLELAGIDPAKIDLEIESDILTVSGERVYERHPDAVYQQMEIDYGRFEKVVALPTEADPSQATASYEAGFLTIAVPLKPRSTSRRIPIAIKDEPDPQEQGGGRS
jgi:HSP20 family protein